MILTVENVLHDKILHKRAKPVKNFQSPEVLILNQEMFKIASSPKAAGVAAPQLGKSLRIFALQTNKQVPVLFFYNPKIIAMSEETYETEEGCLSVPGKICKVTRHNSVTLVWEDELGRKFDPKGRKYQYTFNGFEAQAIQHEMHHLDGTLILDIAEETYEHAQFEEAFNQAQEDLHASMLKDTIEEALKEDSEETIDEE